MIVTPQLRDAGDLVVTAPPSKSYTHRALIMGALGTGPTTILHPLYAEDTLLTINALRMLGISIDENPDRVIITGCEGKFPDRENTVLDLDNSGTSLRLITPLALLCRHPVAGPYNS
jgi:3-phosphoshikimate 1-carboxyvinyltransferase